tara:strand:- start:233 stop:379 length:147 start_codon:yes stop_codon:yes gene_type:complete
LSVDELSTTIILSTIFGIESTTRPIDCSSLNAGITTAILILIFLFIDV